MRPSTIFASVLGVFLGTTGLAMAGDVSCGSLDVHINSNTVKGDQHCSDGQYGRVDDGILLTQHVEVKNPSFVFYLDHVEVGNRTYLNRQSFEELLENVSNFERMDNMTVYSSANGYSARKFTGVMSEDRSYPCFAITRYFGTAFSGPRHLVFGLYCHFSEDEIDDSRIDEVIEAIKTDF